MTILKNAKEVFRKLTEYTSKKATIKALSLYDTSDSFKFIDGEGKVLNYSQLEEMYKTLFDNLDYVNVIENNITYQELSSDYCLCLWQGKERIKMKYSEEVISSWTATVLVGQFENSCKITHFHLIHF